jgi:hypothetical protein
MLINKFETRTAPRGFPHMTHKQRKIESAKRVTFNIVFEKNYLPLALITCLGLAFFSRPSPAPEPDFSEAAATVARQSVAEGVTARRAVTSGDYETRAGYCSRFVRQVGQTNHGSRFDFLYQASAKQTANVFLKAGYGFVASRDMSTRNAQIRAGDFLFKRFGSGGFGHAGVYVGSELVAENSSTVRGRVRGALGYRTLSGYGYFDVIGRLPAPKRLYLKTETGAVRLVGTGEFYDDVNFWRVQSGDVARALGLKSSTPIVPRVASKTALRDALAGRGYKVSRVEYSNERDTVFVTKG